MVTCVWPWHWYENDLSMCFMLTCVWPWHCNKENMTLECFSWPWHWYKYGLGMCCMLTCVKLTLIWLRPWHSLSTLQKYYDQGKHWHLNRTLLFFVLFIIIIIMLKQQWYCLYDLCHCFNIIHGDMTKVWSQLFYSCLNLEHIHNTVTACSLQ